jgi:hypothetical protein
MPTSLPFDKPARSSKLAGFALLRIVLVLTLGAGFAITR